MSIFNFIKSSRRNEDEFCIDDQRVLETYDKDTFNGQKFDEPEEKEILPNISTYDTLIFNTKKKLLEKEKKEPDLLLVGLCKGILEMRKMDDLNEVTNKIESHDFICKIFSNIEEGKNGKIEIFISGKIQPHTATPEICSVKQYQIINGNSIEIKTYKTSSMIFCIEKVGSLLYGGSYLGKIYSWNVNTTSINHQFANGLTCGNGNGNLKRKANTHHKRMIYSLKHYKRTLISSSQDGYIKQWTIGSGELLQKFKCNLPVISIGISTDESKCFFQDINELEISKLYLKGYHKTNKGKQGDMGIGELEISSQATIENIKIFHYVAELEILLLWNGKTGEIEIRDVEVPKEILLTRFLPNVRFVKYLTCNYNSNDITKQQSTFSVLYGTSCEIGEFDISVNKIKNLKTVFRQRKEYDDNQKMEKQKRYGKRKKNPYVEILNESYQEDIDEYNYDDDDDEDISDGCESDDNDNGTTKMNTKKGKDKKVPLPGIDFWDYVKIKELQENPDKNVSTSEIVDELIDQRRKTTRLRKNYKKSKRSFFFASKNY